MITKTTLLLLPVFLLSIYSQAQDYYRAPLMNVRSTSAIGIQLGGNNFLGDLGGTKGSGAPFIKDLNMKATRPYVGFTYSYFPDNGWSINAGFHLTSVSAADSLIEERVGHAFGRYDRNLSFKSSIYELQATLELYPIQLINDESTSRFMPYIGTGFGFFHFNPKTQLNGQWYYLKPLRLEGQGFAEYPERKNYNLNQLYIPLSAGLKYRLSNSYMLSLDAIFRKTFTDYIDDVSTSYINPDLFDKYLSSYSATIAKQLYYRGRQGIKPQPGTIRGYSGNDSYTSVFLTITYLLNQNSLPSYHDKPPAE